jgi:hypothetical protein
MNASSIFIDNLRTGSIYSVNDIRTSEFSINSLGSYVYDVLNSSSIQGYAKLNSTNLFLYPPQTDELPTLSNQFATKGYIDSIISGLFSYSVSHTKIGETYYSEWTSNLTSTSLTTLNTIYFDSPGVWQIYTQFEYNGEGILTQIQCGYNEGTMFKEDITIALETNDVVQRFVPYVFVNDSGSATIDIVSNIQVNTGTIYVRCKYFYVKIA